MNAVEQAERIVRDYPTPTETDRAVWETLFVIGAFCWLVAWAWAWWPR